MKVWLHKCACSGALSEKNNPELAPLKEISVKFKQSDRAFHKKGGKYTYITQTWHCEKQITSFSSFHNKCLEHCYCSSAMFSLFQNIFAFHSNNYFISWLCVTVWKGIVCGDEATENFHPNSISFTELYSEDQFIMNVIVLLQSLCSYDVTVFSFFGEKL